MSNKLVVFGCSNTFGQGLEDCFIPPLRPGFEPSKFAWPELLAEKLGLSCVNLSWPGYSNKAIWNKVVNTSLQSADLVIVAWSMPERWCILNSDDDLTDVDHFGTWSNNKQAKSFYKRLYSDTDMNIDMNIRIHHTKLYLNSMGIENFHTIDQSSDLVQLRWNNTPIIETYFFDISSEYPKALDNQHPGREAHRVYSQELYKEVLKRRTSK